MARASKERELAIWMNGRPVALWRLPSRGPMELHYHPDWEAASDGRPLSLSLPFLGGAPHRGPVVANYFDNLLPESAEVRKRLQSRFRIASDDAFDLLAAIGRDCVGAVQLLPTNEGPGDVTRIQAEALTDAAVEALLHATTAPPLGETSDDDLRISIAGAQEKTALLLHKGRWCKPIGSTPTTHILKLPLGIIGGSRQIDMSTSVENEWLCSKILEAYGLPVAHCDMAQFGKQKVLVVQRFDRTLHSSKRYWLRLPQEDFCQATGTPFHAKYESQGGPGILEIAQILRHSENAQADLSVLMQAQLLFWMLAAPDGHAKNFSIHLLAGGHYRLTPLYDVISVWPAIGGGPNQFNEHKTKLAMALRGKSKHYLMKSVQRRHFNETARRAHLGADMEPLIERIIEQTPGVIKDVRMQLPKGFPRKVADPIFAGLRTRAVALQAERGE